MITYRARKPMDGEEELSEEDQLRRDTLAEIRVIKTFQQATQSAKTVIHGSLQLALAQSGLFKAVDASNDLDEEYLLRLVR